MSEAPVVPVDDAALDAIEHALGTSLTFTAEDGSELPEDMPRRVGGDYGLQQLLDFWAGIDPNEEGILTGYAGSIPIYDMPGVYLTEHDLVRALIAEIRRLRATP